MCVIFIVIIVLFFNRRKIIIERSMIFQEKMETRQNHDNCNNNNNNNNNNDNNNGKNNHNYNYYHHHHHYQPNQDLQLLSFKHQYEVKYLLGQGGFGRVYAGVRIRDKLPVAIKQVFKINIQNWGMLNGQRIPLEICLLKKVSHIRGVINLITWFEETKYFLIIMERPEPAKDLFDYITEKKRLPEIEAQYLFYQLVDIVKQCYEEGVIHGDIKDENVIITNKEGCKIVKLIDFGSGAFLDNYDCTNFNGCTEVYAPPEWIREKQFKPSSATVWSLGILLYDMVCGNIPFKTNNQIIKCKITFNGVSVSKEFQSLIRLCLQYKPEDRPTLKDILNHSWFK